ncbi:hypothetical protein [Brenneria populi]|uniref:hypothetical protein n=1 Tax=Brenneria populi TaxID=1505588 RepID=UPI002E1979C0
MKSNPSKGTNLIFPAEKIDPHFAIEAGFQKKTMNYNFSGGGNIEIHYQYNKYTGKAYDMKIVSKINNRFKG